MKRLHPLALGLALAWATSAGAQTATPFDPSDLDDPANPASGGLPVDPSLVIAVDPVDPDFDPNDPRWRGLIPPQLRAPRPPTPVFKASLGQAFSLREDDEAIELIFDEQPALGETLGVRVHRLEIEPAVLRLTAGESFALDELVVRAYGTDGALVEHAPLRLEIEAPEGFIDLDAFESDGKTLATLTRGIGRLWVTSMLPALLGENYSLPVILIVRQPGVKPHTFNPRIYENDPPLPES